jgi:hypothetical protein
MRIHKISYVTSRIDPKWRSLCVLNDVLNPGLSFSQNLSNKDFKKQLKNKEMNNLGP